MRRLILLLLPALFIGSAVVAMTGAGLSSLGASTLTVCASGCDHTTIQAAVNAASPGDVITVGAGTYAETVTLNKALTLNGPNAGTPGASGSRVPEAVVTAFDLQATVTVDGFQVGEGAWLAASEWAGMIAQSGAGSVIQNNKFLRTGGAQQAYSAFGRDFQSTRGLITNWGGPSGLVIQDNAFTGYATGVYLQNVSGAQVTDNVLTGNGMSLDYMQNVTVTGNTFDGNGIAGTQNDAYPLPWVTVTGNTFQNGAKALNCGPGTLEAEANTFVGYTDISALLTGSGCTGTVDASPWKSAATSWHTNDSVQDAVDAAASGDAIGVAAGTYVGGVTITKSLTITGAGNTATVIQADGGLGNCFTTSRTNAAVVCVTGTGVAVELVSLRVDGAGLGNAYTSGDNGFHGVAAHNADLTLNSVAVVDVRNTPFDNAQYVNGVYGWYDDGAPALAPHTVEVLGSSVTGFQKTGIVVNNDDLTYVNVTVDHSAITGAGATGVLAQNGYQAWGHQIVSHIDENVISAIAYTDPSTVATGVLFIGGEGHAYGNAITNVQNGIYFADAYGSADLNSVYVHGVGLGGFGISATDPPRNPPAPSDDRGAAGIAARAGRAAGTQGAMHQLLDVDITRNTIGANTATNTYGITVDEGYGMFYPGRDLDLEITRNAIYSVGTAVAFGQCTGLCGGGTITALEFQYNDFTASALGVASTRTGTVNAAFNYWGSAAQPVSPTNFTGDVVATPWLGEALPAPHLPLGTPSILFPPISGSPELKVEGTDLVFYDNGVEIGRVPLASAGPITIDGTGGDDTLALDFSGGNPIPAGGITFNGGAGDDAIEITGGTATNVVHTFASASDGTIAYDGKTVTYTGLEPILDGVAAATRTFSFGVTGDAITLADDGTPDDGYSTIDSPNSESVTFLAPTTSLTVNGFGGPDVITLGLMDSQQGGTIYLNGNGSNDVIDVRPASGFAVTVNGGTNGGPGDRLTITPGTAVGFTHLPVNATDGSVAFTAPTQGITYTNIEVFLPDVSILQTVTPNPAYPAGAVDVSLLLSNTGDIPATGLAVGITLPSGFDNVAASTPSAGTSYAGGTWTVGTVNAGATATLTVTVLVGTDQGASVVSEVTAQDYYDYDSTPNNHVTTEDDYQATLITVGELGALPSNAIVKGLALTTNGLALAASYGNGMFRSNGASWTAVNTGLTNLSTYDVVVDGNNNVFVATLGGGIFKATFTPPSTLSAWTLSGLAGGSIRGLAVGAANEIYAVGDVSAGSRVWKSTDAGATWTALGLLEGGRAVEPWAITVDPTNASRLYVASRRGVYRSSDDGATWTLNSTMGGTFSALVLPDGTVLVGTKNDIRRSTNNGVTFTVAAASAQGRSVYDLYRHPVSGRIYAALYGRPGVVVSTNLGTTFVDVPMISIDGNVQAVIEGPDGKLYVAVEGQGIRVIALTPTGVEQVDVPEGLTLEAPAPNPARSNARLRYGLPEGGAVRLAVYDALGREVARLADGEQAAGWHVAQFDGNGLGAGVYIVRLEAAGRILTRTLNLVR